MLILDEDAVMPVVTKVVDVVETPRIDAERIVQDDALLIDVAGLVVEIRIGIAVAHTVDHEFMQMAVGPAECGLKDLMEFREFDAGRHDEAAPDVGTHVEELDLELPGPGGWYP